MDEDDKSDDDEDHGSDDDDILKQSILNILKKMKLIRDSRIDLIH